MFTYSFLCLFFFFVYSVLQPTKISAFLFCLPCDALKMLSCYLESGIWHSFKKEKARRGRRNPAHSRVMQSCKHHRRLILADTHTYAEHLVPHVATCERQASNSDCSALVTQIINKSLVSVHTHTHKQTNWTIGLNFCQLQLERYTLIISIGLAESANVSIRRSHPCFPLFTSLYFSQATVNALKGGSVYIMLKLMNLHTSSHLGHKAVAKILMW